MADILVTGLSLRERDELNRVARKRRMTQAKFLRELIRAAIGSDERTGRRHEEPTITERLALEWATPGHDEARHVAELERKYGKARVAQLRRKWARERAAREAAAGPEEARPSDG